MVAQAHLPPCFWPCFLPLSLSSSFFYRNHLSPCNAVADIELLGVRTLSSICANPFPTSGLVELQALNAPGWLQSTAIPNSLTRKTCPKSEGTKKLQLVSWYLFMLALQEKNIIEATKPESTWQNSQVPGLNEWLDCWRVLDVSLGWLMTVV